MRTITKFVPLVLFGAAVTVQACGSQKYDTEPGHEFLVAGVIRGTILYSGPPPCSQNGHIVGNAIALVFDRRNPPPPSGLGNTAVNFVTVPGDVLFANWPRTPGPTKICPDPSQSMTASAPYAIGPMDAGSYVIQGFYDYTGDFLPTFKFRQLPEVGDVGGGYIDINDANALVPNLQATPAALPDGGTEYPLVTKQSDPNYQPIFLNVDIGTPGPVPPTSLRGVPSFTMPANGFLADNITISLGARLGLARPYFWPEGVIFPAGQTSDDGIVAHGSSDVRNAPSDAYPNPDFEPVLTFPQDLKSYAQPPVNKAALCPALVDEYQAALPQVSLHFGLPPAELATGTNTTDPGDPFHFQIGTKTGGNDGINVWWDGNSTDPLENFIPEGTVPRFWPLVVAVKLDDDPSNQQQLIPQGSDLKKPVVVIQGITLRGDSLFDVALNKISKQTFPSPANRQDHVTAILRPSALCFDPRKIDNGATLVTPYFTSTYPPNKGGATTCTLNNTPPPAVVNVASVVGNPQLKYFIPNLNAFQERCIPPGRYSINVVYPTGQAWTVPNETGSCAATEGATDNTQDPGTCTGKPRPVLYSQGTRAVIEVLPSTSGYCEGAHAVPDACSTLPP